MERVIEPHAKNKLAHIMRDLIQEKIKIGLNLGEARMSEDIKKILYVLNEY